MKKMHPGLAWVIALIALFLAMGGTSYAAVTSLAANSVGTKQLKNGAVTAKKLNASALAGYLKQGATLPSGKTEVGDWGSGAYAGTDGGGADARPVFTFPVPLASGIAAGHTVVVTGASATHCSGAGHADPGYLCVYEVNKVNALDPVSTAIFNPEANGASGTGAHGFGLPMGAIDPGDWSLSGTYAVTAP
jgi:hypothetical protein